MDIDTNIVKGFADIFCMNPLKDLRERQNLTRQEMGELLGLQAPSIDKYESDLGKEAARMCADLARKWGHYDLVPTFKRMAGETPKGNKLDPTEWTPEERELVATLLDILRQPKTTTDRLIPNFIMETADNRRKLTEKK